MSRAWLWPLAVGVLSSSIGSAKQAATPIAASGRMSPLLNCSTISSDTDRLTCFDREAAVIRKALADKEIAVVEQSDVRRSQRELFGIAVPRVKLFDALGDGDLSKLETSVVSVGHTGDGGLSFTVSEGSTWEQVDDYPVSSVKPGRKVTLKRGALGSFFAAFNQGVSIRVRRVN